jgi:hypothetical protein
LFVQALEVSGELAVEAGFIARERVEGPAITGHRAVREGGPGGVVFVLVDLSLFADFVVPGGDLENPHAVLTPETRDKLFDEGGFDGADGIIPGEKIVVVVFCGTRAKRVAPRAADS